MHRRQIMRGKNITEKRLCGHRNWYNLLKSLQNKICRSVVQKSPEQRKKRKKRDFLDDLEMCIYWILIIIHLSIMRHLNLYLCCLNFFLIFKFAICNFSIYAIMRIWLINNNFPRYLNRMFEARLEECSVFRKIIDSLKELVKMVNI